MLCSSRQTGRAAYPAHLLPSSVASAVPFASPRGFLPLARHFFLKENNVMTARSIRRAQERKARKEMQRTAKTAALQAEKHLAPQAAEPVLAAEPATSHAPIRRPLRPVLSESLCWNNEPLDDSPTQQTKEARLFTPALLSPAQLAANRANAQLSPGPTSPEGKAKSSLNAVKTALTGRTVLLPSDDAPDYERHLRAYADDLRPLGARECDLLQSIADTAWRLKRIPCLETAIFAQGYIEFGEAFNDHDPSLRASMIEVQTFFKYEKQLRNLQLQESRLARRREKEMAELRQLQQERRQKEKQQQSDAPEVKQSNEPPSNGFVFSTTQTEEHQQRVPARNMPLPAESASQIPAPQALKPTTQAA